jgi:hypothetical protein
MTLPDASKWLDTIWKVAPVSLVTGVSGYFARIFQAEGRKKHMREQLYQEISNNYQRMLDRISLAAKTASSERAPYQFYMKLDLSFNVWNFYNDEKRREMLFDLKEAEAISRIYDKFLGIGIDEAFPEIARLRGKLTAAGLEDYRSDELSMLLEAKTRGDAAAEVDDRLLDGTLDRKLYRKVSSPAARTFMDDLLNGKRQSYQTFLIPH